MKLLKRQEKILTDENIKELVDIVNEEWADASSLFEKQLGEIGQRLGQTQRKLSKLYAALETGRVNIEDLAPRIKELRAQQKELEDKQNRLLDEMNNGAPRTLSLEQVQEHVADLKALLESNSFIEQKSFLR
jgi:septal ring factor EnvC (AmiA/AmiB activator)